MKAITMDASSRTKKYLADALKRLSSEKPLAKITVKDLCEYSHVNRGTFYYHFKDINNLINWIYHTEITIPSQEIIKNYPITSMPSVTSFMLEKCSQDRDFYIQAFALDGPQCLKEFVLKESEDNWKCLWQTALQIDDFDALDYEGKEYLLQYFTRGHFYATQSWIEGGMKTQPEVLGRVLDFASLTGLVSIWKDILGLD